MFESKRDGNYEIYVMDSDGSDQRRLTVNQAHDGFPAWSPDGTQVAFMSQRDGNYEIYTMSADGTNQQRLTDNPAADSDPAWSPDGSLIVYTRYNPAEFSEENGHLWIMDSNGENKRQLTHFIDTIHHPNQNRKVKA